MKLYAGDKLIIASHNPGKLREISELLSGHDLLFDSAGNLGLDEPEETERTFQGNALLKARFVSSKTGLIALADDSGLVVPALDGQPGVDSAYWGGPERNHHLANKKVIDLLQDKPRDAHFVCVLAVVWPNGNEVTFEGKSYGSLTWPERGTLGFGFDPIFIPNAESRTYGEMTKFEKSQTSHRSMAFTKLKEELLNEKTP